MHPATSFPPQLLDALARIRAALRESKPPQAALLYQMLLGLSLQALSESLPAPAETAALGQSREASQGPLFISVADASTRYPISRSFLYEHGEQEGIVTRPTGTRGKVVVDVCALERWLRRGHA